MNKTYVEVCCRSLDNGVVLPSEIIWKDGRCWSIDRVLHSCTASENEFEGIRYTVLIGSAEKYLYQLGKRWYVEPS